MSEVEELQAVGDYLMVAPNISNGKFWGFDVAEYTDEGLFEFYPKYSRINSKDMFHLCVIINTVIEEYIKTKVIEREKDEMPDWS
jgi:hypothetical protein